MGAVGVRATRITGSRPGVVFAPFHYGTFNAGPDDPPRAANELTRTEWDPVSKQPIYKVTAVAIEKVVDGQPAAVGSGEG